MWFFQHKNFLENYLSWAIVSITITVHIIMLCGLFFLYRNFDDHFTVFFDKKIAPNIDITLLSSVVNRTSKATSISTNQKQSAVISSSKEVPPNPTIKAQPSSPVLKNNNNKTPAIQKTSPTKPTARSKNTPLKKEDVKNSKQELLKKNNAQPLKKKDPDANKNQILKKQMLEKPPIQSEQIVQPSSLAKPTTENVITEDVSELSLKEYETLKKIAYLQDELKRVWRPPTIQKANPSCTLEIFINWHGTIEHINIIESSGVLLFDTTARKAAYDIKIPQWAKGKSITIMLKA